MIRSGIALLLWPRSFASACILAAPVQAIAQDLNVHTSSSNYEAAVALVERYSSAHEGNRSPIEVSSTGSGGAIKLLCSGDGSAVTKTRVAIVARPVQSIELDGCRAEGVTLVGEKLPWADGDNYFVARETDMQSDGPVRRLYDFAFGRGVAAASHPASPPPGVAPSTAPAPPSPASAAAEAWDTEFGEVVYERDIGTWAVWRFGPAGSGPGAGKIFIDRLGGVTSGRGAYGGYWMFYDSPDKPCAEARSDIDGNASQNYGAFQVTFLDPEAPGRWSAQWGACDGPATAAWNGTPKAAATEQQPPVGQTPVAGSGGGWLGVRLQTVTPEIAESLGMTRAVGAIVTAIETNSPAAVAGIAAGDVIWSLNGTEIASSRDLASLIGTVAADAIVELEIVREGGLINVPVTLARRPEPSQAIQSTTAQAPTADRPADAEDDTIARVGNLVLMPTTPLTRSIFEIGDDIDGLVVTAAAPQGKALPYLPSGSVIVEAGGATVATVEQLRAAISAQSLAGSRPLLLRILQPGYDNHIFVALGLDEFTAEPVQLLTDAGVAYDRGDSVVLSNELAAGHLLAAVADGDAEAIALLTERPTTLDQTTREIIQRRLADAGHYQGGVDGVFGPSTRRALLDYRSDE